MSERRVLSSREEIAQRDDLAKERVEVPEWDCDVIVRALTGKERENFERTIASSRGKDGNVQIPPGLRANLIIACVVDEEGNPVFDKDDVEMLSQKSGSALDKLATAALQVSGMVPEATAEAKANFDGNPAEDSSSD